MMSLLQRILRLALGAVLSGAALTAGLAVRATTSDAFTPYVPQTPPQRAEGDFDGDGRLDTARIRDGPGTGGISIQLSGSSASVDLKAAITGIAEDDIDHDGDLDLVATTDRGDLLIWINDGHGRFTPEPAIRTSGMSGQPVVGDGTSSDAVAIGISVLSLASLPPGATPRGGASVRPLAAGHVPHSRRAILPPLRAPPVRAI